MTVMRRVRPVWARALKVRKSNSVRDIPCLRMKKRNAGITHAFPNDAQLIDFVVLCRPCKSALYYSRLHWWAKDRAPTLRFENPLSFRLVYGRARFLKVDKIWWMH